MSLVIDAVTNHKAELRNREDQVMQEMARRWLQVEAALRDQVDALTMQISGLESLTLAQLNRLERYNRLAQQIDAQISAYEAFAVATIEREQRLAVQMAAGHSAALINSAALDSGVSVQFGPLPVEAVTNIVGQAGDGSPLAAILEDASTAGREALRRELITGVALGRNPVEMARRVMRQGLGTTFTRTATIYRTEVLRAYRYTSQRAYQRSNVVTGYRRISAKDARTCVACLMADGNTYPLDHDFDQHPNCRCAMIPIIQNRQLPIETGKDWFMRQSPEARAAILGRGRYELWTDGDIELSDMITRVESPTWGGALVPTSIEALRAMSRR